MILGWKQNEEIMIAVPQYIAYFILVVEKAWLLKVCKPFPTLLLKKVKIPSITDINVFSIAES